MNHHEFTLSVRERSTYDRIQSELNTMSNEVETKSIPAEEMPGFMDRYKKAIEAREQLIENIALDRCLMPTQIISIFEGKVFYR